MTSAAQKVDNGGVNTERKEEFMSEHNASENPQDPAEKQNPGPSEVEREEQLVEEEERESFPASDPPANY